MKRILVTQEADGAITLMVENGAKVRVFVAEGDGRPREYIPRLSSTVMDAALPPTRRGTPVAMPSVAEMSQALERTAEAMTEPTRLTRPVRAHMEGAAPDRTRMRPTVSDHALVRWLEREKKVDVEAIKREILTPRIETAIRAGASSVCVGGLRLVISEENVVVTVLEQRPRSGPPRRSGRVATRPRPDERREIAEYFEDMAEDMVG